MWLLLLFGLLRSLNASSLVHNHGHGEKIPWLVNDPPSFRGDTSISILRDTDDIKSFRTFVTEKLKELSGATDGEIGDALEHFFWGKTHGLSLELGAADGTKEGESVTFEYEEKFHWKRILVEGDPNYGEKLLKGSPNAFIANCPICATHQIMHYAGLSKYTGGILEFMTPNFMEFFHPLIYNSTKPPGNISSITNWDQYPNVKAVDCIPLKAIIKKADASHINYFVLDVEGAELQVLESIEWSRVRFDVLCVETNPSRRPPGNLEKVTLLLKAQGYKQYSHQQGFIRNDFVPFTRPGLSRDCFNAVKKNSEFYHGNYKERCKMTDPE